MFKLSSYPHGQYIRMSAIDDRPQVLFLPMRLPQTTRGSQIHVIWPNSP